ncbi:hypothetical protein CRUP_029251, partial [Coryphaenoides rupestris]
MIEAGKAYVSANKLFVNGSGTCPSKEEEDWPTEESQWARRADDSGPV